MSGQIPLGSGRELRLQGEDGGVRTVVVEDVLGFGGSCVVYRVRETGGCRRILKEFYPHPRTLPGLSRQGDALVVPEECREGFVQRQAAFDRGLSRYCAYYEDDSVYANPRPFLYGRANGTSYALSDPTQGQVLSEADRSALSLSQAAQIMVSLCGALRRFHDRGLLYLDCKPENIFLYQVDRRDHVRLFDFDTVASREDLRQGAPLSCSAGWAPEEQRRGRVEDLGEEADIYAVGGVFFWLLTGERPGAQALREISRGRFRWRSRAPLLEEASERVLETVGRIAGHTLRDEIEERYGDIVTLRRDLQELAGLAEDDAVVYRPLYEEMAGFGRELAAIQESIRALRQGDLSAAVERISFPELQEALRREVEKLQRLEATVPEGSRALQEQRERVDELSENMLRSWTMMAEYHLSGDRASRDRREQRAMETAIQGSYAKANEILRDPSWRGEIRSLSTVLEEARVRCERYISGQKLLISNLRAMGVGDAVREEVDRVYQELLGLAEEYQVSYEVFYDYALFLYSQHDYRRGIETALRLRQLYALRPTKDGAAEARLEMLLSRLHYRTHDYAAVEGFYRQAEALYRAHPGERLEEQVQLYNHIADYAWRQHLAGEARRSLERALALLDALPETTETLRERALAYTRLATLANRQWRLDEAEDYHRKARRILEALLEQDPGNDERIQDVAKVCGNLGIVCRRKEHYGDAEEAFLRATRLRDAGFVRNRRKFALGYAIGYSNYAYMLACAGRLPEAETMIRKALPVKEALVAELRETYLSSYGISLDIYAFILGSDKDPERQARAEETYREALACLEEAAQWNAHSNALPECRDRYAVYLEKMGRREDTAAQTRLALADWLRLSREDESYYVHEIAVDSIRLGRLLGSTPEGLASWRQAVRSSRAGLEKAAPYFREDHETALRGLLAALEGQGDPDGEVPALKEALRHLERGGTADEG